MESWHVNIMWNPYTNMVPTLLSLWNLKVIYQNYPPKKLNFPKKKTLKNCDSKPLTDLVAVFVSCGKEHCLRWLVGDAIFTCAVTLNKNWSKINDLFQPLDSSAHPMHPVLSKPLSPGGIFIGKNQAIGPLAIGLEFVALSFVFFT